MIDELHFFVDRKTDCSILDVQVETDGLRILLHVETPDPAMSAWSKESIDDFGNEVNALMVLVMADFHRLRQSISRNAQLEAVGLPGDYTELLQEVDTEDERTDDTTESEAVA